MSASPPIVVALSGGVDSAAVAAMLVERGERVIGMTMRLYDAGGTVAGTGRCCGPRDIEDARRVAEHLGIPYYVVDFESVFNATVVDDFVDAYLGGETPNPCVKCNQYIKFTPLLQRARALGAEVVATGHYARIEAREDGGWDLRRGVDTHKDQSYFLFSMPAGELGSVWFPLGGLRKDEVRALAARAGLPNAAKGESQEICFVPDGDYAGFVERAALTRGRPVPPPGDVVDQRGRVLGQHRGVHHFTIGQRRGLGNLATTDKVYVVDIDRERHQVTVGPAESAAAATLWVRDVQWIRPRPVQSLQVQTQVRYRGKAAAGTVRAIGTGAVVTFAEREPVAAAGQAAVFYEGDAVVGGGWIATTPPKA